MKEDFLAQQLWYVSVVLERKNHISALTATAFYSVGQKQEACGGGADAEDNLVQIFLQNLSNMYFFKEFARTVVVAYLPVTYRLQNCRFWLNVTGGSWLAKDGQVGVQITKLPTQYQKINRIRAYCALLLYKRC